MDAAFRRGPRLPKACFSHFSRDVSLVNAVQVWLAAEARWAATGDRLNFSRRTKVSGIAAQNYQP
jgi:hypothetical protein